MTGKGEGEEDDSNGGGGGVDDDRISCHFCI